MESFWTFFCSCVRSLYIGGENLDFILDNLLFIISFIVVILLISFFIKKAVKIFLVLTVVCLTLIFLFDVSPSKIFDFSSESAESVYKHSVKPFLEEELKNASYTVTPEKQYTITTKSFKINGILGENKATLSYKEHQFRIDVTPLEHVLREIESEYNRKTN
jgi:hypothetical protein